MPRYQCKYRLLLYTRDFPASITDTTYSQIGIIDIIIEGLDTRFWVKQDINTDIIGADVDIG